MGKIRTGRGRRNQNRQSQLVRSIGFSRTGQAPPTGWSKGAAEVKDKPPKTGEEL